MTVLPQTQTFLPNPTQSALKHYMFPVAMLARLQKEHGWTDAFLTGVLEEYRRFLQLAAYAGHAVTPSTLVDEVWHMHLTFTRDYWEKLSPLLPAPLHHEPALGLPGDTQKYADQYIHTLDAYQVMFGQPAPATYWPDPRQVNARHVNARHTHPRATPPRWLPVAFGLAGALALAYLSSNVIGFILSAITALIVGGVIFVKRQAGQDPTSRTSSSGGGGCGTSGAVFNSGSSADSGGADGGSCGSGCGSGCGGGGCGN